MVCPVPTVKHASLHPPLRRSLQQWQHMTLKASDTDRAEVGLAPLSSVPTSVPWPRNLTPRSANQHRPQRAHHFVIQKGTPSVFSDSSDRSPLPRAALLSDSASHRDPCTRPAAVATAWFHLDGPDLHPDRQFAYTHPIRRSPPDTRGKHRTRLLLSQLLLPCRARRRPRLPRSLCRCRPLWPTFSTLPPLPPLTTAIKQHADCLFAPSHVLILPISTPRQPSSPTAQGNMQVWAKT